MQINDIQLWYFYLIIYQDITCHINILYQSFFFFTSSGATQEFLF